uniref:Uncharacterized protein n=1 Tax=Magnetospirillum gryphiswaldense TaxID=55518 RepID=A4U3Z5_9PROT|nr:hypothetical protein MGR_1137 [Magnetospirillum gryphiswaldense MSR-1]
MSDTRIGPAPPAPSPEPQPRAIAVEAAAELDDLARLLVRDVETTRLARAQSQIEALALCRPNWPWPPGDGGGLARHPPGKAGPHPPVNLGRAPNPAPPHMCPPRPVKGVANLGEKKIKRARTRPRQTRKKPR